MDKLAIQSIEKMSSHNVQIHVFILLHCRILRMSFFPDTAFPEQVMMTLSPEEKEQFLSLKKRLKDLSKGS